MKQKNNRNYYVELSKKVEQFELGREHSSMLLSAISDKVVWCWHWRKITEDQLDDLCKRITILFDSRTLDW